MAPSSCERMWHESLMSSLTKFLAILGDTHLRTSSTVRSCSSFANCWCVFVPEFSDRCSCSDLISSVCVLAMDDFGGALIQRFNDLDSSADTVTLDLFLEELPPPIALD